MNVPVTKKEMTTNAIYLSAYNEIFLQPQSPVFDRDRIYGAIGYVFNPNVRAEAGWMIQLYEDRSWGQFQFGLFNNLPLKKMEKD